LAARLTALAAAALAVAGAAEAGELRFLESAQIADKAAGLSEPSGLALSADGRGFWTVSDDAPRILFIGRDGTVDPARSVDIGADDLEGVTEDPARGRLLVVSESSAEIVSVDLADGAVARHPLAEMAGWEAAPRALRESDPRDGLEGIAVEAATGNVFVVKERAPRLLLELTPDLARIRGALPLDAARGFADEETGDDRLDVSGLVVDAGRGGLWIVSDTGGRAFLLDLDTLQARSWPLLDGESRKAERIRNAEGVALSADGRTLSVVTDDGKRSRLYRYAIEID
jgi:uncharacterized protein YjiK